VGGRLGFPLIFARVEAPPRSLPFCFLAVACGILQVVRVFQGLLAVLRALCLSLLRVLCDSSSFFLSLPSMKKILRFRIFGQAASTVC
jgi:hypothetical protein